MPRKATGVNLRTLSIKRKLMLITMSTSTVALLLASVGFVVYDLVAFRSQMSDDLMTQAEIVGANSMAALAFRDGPAAREILSALKAREGIVAAALYAPDGSLVADYRRDNGAVRAVPARPDSTAARGSKTTISGCSIGSNCTGRFSAPSMSSLTCSNGTSGSSDTPASSAC